MTTGGNPFRSELVRMMVAVLVTLAASISVAMANRSVYSRAEIDQRVTALEKREDTRHESLDKELSYMRDDIRWIVRQMGGTPSAGSAPNNRTP